MSQEQQPQPQPQKIDISNGQGLLFKTILTPGIEPPHKPTKNCQVTVHYPGTLTSNGKKFDSSRDRNDPFQFKLGQGQVIRGWDVGVATMSTGERALLEIDSQWGYGERGAGADIPGGASLTFDVELLSWSLPDFSKSGNGSIVGQVFDVEKLSSENTNENEKNNKNDDDENMSDEEAEEEKRVVKQSVGDVIRVKLSVWKSEKCDLSSLSSVSDGDSGKVLVEEVGELAFVKGDETVHPIIERLVSHLEQVGQRATFFVRDSCSELVPVPGNEFESDKVYSYMTQLSDNVKLALKQLARGELKSVQFDMELLGVQRAPQCEEFSPEQLIEYCERKKNEGNEFFKACRLGMAIKRYNDVVYARDCFDDDLKETFSEDQIKTINNLVLTANNNLAVVYYKQQDYHKTRVACRAALDVEPNNVKALFKRSQSYSAEQKFDEAITDLNAALAADPGNKLVEQELKNVKAKIQKVKEAEKRLYQRMFQSVGDE